MMHPESLRNVAKRAVRVQAALERLTQAKRQRNPFEYDAALKDFAALEEDHAKLQATLDRLDRAADEADRRGEVEAAVAHLIRKGMLLVRMERRSEGLACMEEALARARQTSDRRLLLTVQVRRAHALGEMGRLPEAEAALDELLEESDQDDRRVRQRLLGQKGDLYLASGRNEEAKEAYGEALEIGELEMGGVEYIDLQLGLARAAVAQGNLIEGGELLTEALERAQAQGEAGRQWEALTELQAVDVGLGQIDAYLGHCHLARRIAEQCGDHIEAAIQREKAVAALLNLGRHEKALTLLHESLEYVRRRGPRMKEIVLLMELGKLYFELERLEEAEGAFRDVLEEAKEQNNSRSMAVALGQLGALYGEQNNLEAARRYGELAIDRIDPEKDPEIAAEQHVLLALTYRDLEDFGKAKQAARKAIDLFERLDSSELAAQARELLDELQGK